MDYDQSDCGDEAEITRTRQKEMIETALVQGRKRDEVIALYGFNADIFERLEASDPAVKIAFKRAETQAFLADLDLLRDNLENKNFNHSACSLYFANRHGWSAKPNKSTKKLLNPQETLKAVLDGDLDVEIGLNILKAVTLHEDLRYREEDRILIKENIEKLERYKKDNGL